MTLLSVTTQARVLRRLDMDPPSGGTYGLTGDQVDQLILAVSQAFEEYLALPLNSEARTEVYSCRRWQSDITLRSYFGDFMTAPTITSVKERTSWKTAWADVTALDSGTYTLSSDSPGLLLLDHYAPVGDDTVQVVYTSGFASSTAAFITAYPAIADAAEAQIAWEYDRRRDPGQSATSIQGSQTTQQEPVRLLASVKERLAPYRRPVFS